MTDDDKALVERLWNRVEYRWDGQTQIREIDTDATYAAHRIEELSEENERLRGIVVNYVDPFDVASEDEAFVENIQLAALGDTK